MRCLVTGVTGQLGYDVCLELKHRGIEYLGVSSKQMDVSDWEQVRRCFDGFRPDAVIHCAAYTKVDLAEEEREKCWAVNAVGAYNIARACGLCGAKLLHVSTEYVFSGRGDNFHEPEDEVDPQNVYGRSKLAGELAVRSLLDRYFIVRTSWAFGVNGGNFVKTMLRLAETHDTLSVVDDQIGSPTYTADLAVLLCDMIQTEKYGVYHACNQGVCSWAEFAEAIFETAGKNVKVERVTTAEYGAKAPRPLNSRMSARSLLNNDFALLPHWRDALVRYIREL